MLGLVLLIAASSMSRVPHAQATGVRRPLAEGKVLVVSGHVALEKALRTSLAPWNLRVEVSAAAPPGDSMPMTEVRAHSLALERGAEAVVWISEGSEGAALWVHDVHSRQITARAIPEPPFDAALAAALALSVKTVLRASRLAPDAPQPSSTGAAARLEAGSAADPLEPLPPATDAAPEVSTMAARPVPPRLRAVLHAGARFGAFHPAQTGAHYGAELRWAPWTAAPGLRRSVWLGLQLETSAPWRVSDATFRGDYWELAPGLCAGISVPLSPALELGLALRGALHFASLSGTLLADGLAVEASRTNPSVLLRPELGWHVGAVDLLLQPAAGFFLMRQIYEDAAAVVLETRVSWWMLGGGLALRID